MAKQALFYEKATAVNSKKHSKWSVKGSQDFGFAKSVNSVPLTAVEFLNAADDYVIVFAGSEGSVMPVAVLGVEEDQNLYVSETGEWQVKYVPAFVRRYPFVFSVSEDGNTFTLCIDEDFAGCNQEDRGERLFDAEGEQTQYLQGVLRFLQQYQAHFRRTEAFCGKLQELGLLEPMQAQYTDAAGKPRTLTGFMAIDRKKLKDLPADTVAEMFRADELELAYLHLHSMRNFDALVARARGTAADAGADEAPDLAEAAPAKPAAASDAVAK